MEYANYIALCIEIARRGEYYVAPNPMVGAVLVQELKSEGVKELKIAGYRGIGTLTNIKGEKAAFNGRKLDANEMTVQPGEINGKPWVITVKAEDNSSVHVYKIKVIG